MQSPFYGRTGLLDSGLHQPLPPPSPNWAAQLEGVAIKWHPESIRVIPERLLHHFVERGGDIPPSFGVLLLLDSLAEALMWEWEHQLPDSSTDESSPPPAIKRETPVKKGPSHSPARRVARRVHRAALLDYLLTWHYHAAERADSTSPQGNHEEEEAAVPPCFRWRKKEIRALRPAVAETDAKPTDGEGGGGLSWFIPPYTLVCVKDRVAVEQFPEISWRPVTLLGKHPHVNDIVLAHPSCSGQHAALQVAFTRLDWEEEVQLMVQEHREDPQNKGMAVVHQGMEKLIIEGRFVSHLEALKNSYLSGSSLTAKLDALLDHLYEQLLDLVEEIGGKDGGAVQSAFSLELQVVDLDSTNGTTVNGEPLVPYTPRVLKDSDTVRFGFSTRSYVLPVHPPRVGQPYCFRGGILLMSIMNSSYQFDGYALLKEQSDLLASASPIEINSTYFLKVKLAAQQRRTAQRNKMQRSQEEERRNSASFEEGQTEMQAASSDPASSGSISMNESHRTRVPATLHADPATEVHTNTKKNKMLDDVPAVASGVREEIPEVMDVLLAPCPYCGRSFAEDRIDRHCLSCMNLSKADQERQRRQRQQQRKETGRGVGSSLAQEPTGGAPADWRKQSSQLRGALNGEPLMEDRVECPYCRRRFQSDTAARHIPLCKDKMSRMQR